MCQVFYKAYILLSIVVAILFSSVFFINNVEAIEVVSCNPPDEDYDRPPYQHKPNYLGYSIYEGFEDPNFPDSQEITFQYSLKVWLPLEDEEKFIFIPVYTQQSFWQLLDKSNSRPFRETNYNPEFILRYQQVKKMNHCYAIDIGYEHESNGGTRAENQGWDRGYVKYILQDSFDKNGYIFNAKYFQGVVFDNRNTAVQVYHGNFELSGVWFTSIQSQEEFYIKNLFSSLTIWERAAEFSFGLLFNKLNNFGIYYRHYNGRAETLDHFRDNIRRHELGIMLKPIWFE